MPAFRSVSRALLVLVLVSAFAGPLALGAPAAPAAPASPAAAPARTAASPLEVKEVALDNGLRIFVLERKASPTFAALYQFGVGGASDPRGRSGIAHLLEHMLFKGTQTLGTLDYEKEARLMERLGSLWRELDAEQQKADDPFHSPDEERVAKLRAEIEEVSAEQKKLIVKNEYDELMTRAGAVGMNASTNHDVTRYYIQLPANRLELWFRMESDRLLNPVFREFYSERDVVYEERRMRYENTPQGQSYEALNGLLYTAHPYGVPVIGWPRDISRLVREDAQAYFTTYYSPSNCVMVLAGDVSAKEVERLAKQYFGPWKRQELPRLPITAEPEQQGERRRVVEFDAKPQLRMGWRTVPEGHPDQYALDVLSMILGGLSSSRIDETIVQRDRIASRAGTWHSSQKYAGSLVASGELRGEHGSSVLEQAIEREVSRIQADGVTAVELERAKVAVEASRVRGLKSNLGQAFRIAEAVFYSGGVGYIEEYERRIDAVTAEQVQDVAKRYLTQQRKNVVEVRQVAGATTPARGGGGAGHEHGAPPGERGARHSVGFEQAMQLVEKAPPVQLRVPEIGKDVQRVELAGGTTVFLKEDHSAPSIEIGFAWLGGSNTAPLEELEVFELASDLLDEGGTESLTPTELQARKDQLGMDFGIWIGSTQSRASFWSLERNFDESFDLALDVIMRPRFDAERLGTLQGQFVESMRRRGESPSRAAAILLDHVIYGDHPRLGFVPSRGEIEAITPDDVRKVWRRYLGRDNLYVTVVGDFRASEMLALLERKLGSWRTAENATREWLPHEPFLAPGLFLVEKDLPQPAIRVYHQIDVDRTAPLPDHASLEILNDILGGSGFRSRLMERLRSDEGLTYGIYSSLDHDGRPGVPGSIRVSYQTKAESVARSIDSVLEEVRRIVAQPVGAGEVAEQIEAWRNRFIFRYTNDFYSVSRLMSNELDDRPYDYDRVLLDAVQGVDVTDVLSMARKHLDPSKLTIAVYGTLTEDDAKALDERMRLVRLTTDQVFPGGYEEEPAAAPAQPEPAPASTN